jgi:hypothetical protein
MLEASPRHLFSNDFVVRSSGRIVGTLDVAIWRERAELEVDGIWYRLYREGMMSGAFVLERAGAIMARAVKPSAFRSRFDVDLGGRPVTLRKLSAFRRTFGIFSGDQQVGVIRPAGMLTRRALVELPSDWPAELQLYLFWLALVIWRREDSAGGS